MGSKGSKQAGGGPPPSVDGLKPEPRLSDEEYKKKLSKEQYRVARQKGTERPFSNEYHNNKKRGVYACVCCSAPLFTSAEKYDSGTGWPSFFAPVGDNVRSSRDADGSRTEVLCRACDGHLGHSFPDGPPPTNTRYCINSASLRFVPAEDK